MTAHVTLALSVPADDPDAEALALGGTGAVFGRVVGLRVDGDRRLIDLELADGVTVVAASRPVVTS